MESLSAGKMNLTSKGKSRTAASRSPRQFAGISAQASRNVFPVNGPDATLQSTPVSHASPSGSLKFDLSGKRGANECAPQILGLKMGSMRVGVGFTRCHALACILSGEKKRQLCCRTPQSDSGFSAGEETLDAPQTFFDPLDGGGVGKPQIAGCAESFAWDDSDLHFVQKHLGNFRATLRERRLAGTIRKMSGNVRERIERAAGPPARDAGNRAQPFDDTLSAFRILGEHDRHRLHRSAHGF